MPPPFNYIVRMSHFCASILVRYQKSYLAEGFQFSSTFLLFDIKKQYFIIQYYSFFLSIYFVQERGSPFYSMLGRSPGNDRKLKLPSPQHVAAGITNKVCLIQGGGLEPCVPIDCPPGLIY